MEEFFAAPRLLEIGFGTLSAAAGLFVVASALRVASTLTLSSHRRAMWVLAVAAVVVVASEIIGVAAALTRPSTLTDVVEGFAEFIAIAAAAAVLHYLYRVEREEISHLRRSANVDGLTGLGSRSFFERAAGRRVEQAMDNGTPLSCVLLDVDDFKAYNDSHGHDAGDEILRCVARIMRESARADDLVGRYGGEEFVLLVNGGAEGALEVAERIRETVERECVPENPPGHPITVSLGVVPLSEETKSLERLIAIADAEMYRSKKTGKNRVSVFHNT
jgi:diguanylate cyclase (GGDEF)-like protein